ncbi:apoptosis inducing factor family protein [Paraburkholderia solisilvae]|uniref:3-phenylpropionate/cinnamic acid dioxygenase ferredoxin--NAD(+) reductase component n=1 Tax=Paraburkholderia solisilvae TaxID=624376 RepID=A0A6J5DNI4_9BURK|nr:apoptosis inducing factor family protein [Paraburkholderia solisilvae]CAB3755473.1 3-phenylpropionate/cinnamic acid dioxygenase ferredoxin--NAD(+) reductase component [Paraburkholderia solisilvae]
MSTQPMQKVAALSELEEAQPRRVKLGDTPILLIRTGNAVHAYSADCPHAGAPLEEGAICHGRLICPWHKATFEIDSGAIVEPPALLPLTRYPVKVEGGDVLVSAESIESASGAADAQTTSLRSDATQGVQHANAAEAAQPQVFAIVGAGAAGAAACAALREFGYRERIVLIDDDAHAPYDRTVLSKFVPSGDMAVDDVPPLLPDGFFEQHQIERLHAHATRLDAQRREIEFDGQPLLRYDAALIATGGTPKLPRLRGSEDPALNERLLLLHNRADAARLADLASQAKHVVVLGGGFIGLEVAASLRKRKLRVTVVLTGSVPFEKQFGAELGRLFMKLHEENGTEFRTNAQIEGVEAGEPLRARLAGGDVLDCDFVVAGTGITPATHFVTGVAHNDDGGLNVDASMRVTDGLYAAGDVAAFPYGDGRRVRIEHWRVAQQHARAAARAMAGAGDAPPLVPFFWTAHFDRNFNYLGHPQSWDEIVMTGTPDTYEFVALLCKHGFVAGALGCGRDTELARLAEAMREPLSRDDARRLIGDNQH